MRKNPPKNPSLLWYDPYLLTILPPITTFLVRSLMVSCRVVKVKGKKIGQEVLSRYRGAVIATWHQRMSYNSHQLRNLHPTIMISRSRDGEYAGRIAACLGFKSVRGSSSRGGAMAIKELIQRIKMGEVGGMLADGPQGPARVAKQGAIILGRDAEVPVIPIMWGADRCWVFNSWDRYMIPKPFARVAVCYGEPILIPKSTPKKGLDEYRSLLEYRLNESARWCDEQFGTERPWRRDRDEKNI